MFFFRFQNFILKLKKVIKFKIKGDTNLHSVLRSTAFLQLVKPLLPELR